MRAVVVWAAPQKRLSVWQVHRLFIHHFRYNFQGAPPT